MPSSAVESSSGQSEGDSAIAEIGDDQETAADPGGPGVIAAIDEPADLTRRR